MSFSHDVLVHGNVLGFKGGFLGLSSITLVTGGPNGPILFDTGHHATKAQLLAALKERGIDPASIREVVLSHLHFDHANNIDLFPNAKFFVHRLEWDYAQKPVAADLYVSGPIVTYLGTCDLVLLEGEGELHPGLRYVPAPGHTPGQMMLCFTNADGARVTLAADAVKTLRELMDRKVDLEFDPEARSTQTITWIAENSDVIVPGHAPELRRTPYGWSPVDINRIELLIR